MEANPFAGERPESAYERLRWGRAPGDVWEIDAPEPLITLGNIAKVYMANGRVFAYPDNGRSPFLVVGLESNCLYLIPRTGSGMPIDVPDDWSNVRQVGRVRRTDYYSDKNDGDAYYYHDHERPYPTLILHPHGCAMLVPASTPQGRSYVVHDDGIIG